MEDINKQLEELNQNFNDKIDSNSHGFSLTKMFKKDGLANKITKSLLLFSLSVGAFGNIANAHTENLLNQDTKIEQTMNFDKQEGLTDYKNLEILTPTMLEEAAELEMSGIWKMPETGDVVILTSNGKFEGNSPEEAQKVHDFLLDHQINTHEENLAPEASRLYGSDIKVINLNKNFFKENKLLSEKDHSLYLEHEVALTAHHEHNHISKGQLEKIKLIREEKGTKFTGKIMEELASDSYSFLMVVKKENLDYETSLELLGQMVDVREQGFSNHLDLSHSTHFGLKSLESMIKNDSNLLKTLKDSSSSEIGSFTSDFAYESFRLLDNQEVSVTRSDMKEDLISYISNGKVLNKSESVVYKKMSEMKSIDGSELLDNFGYEKLMEDMSNKLESKEGMTPEKAVNSIRTAKRTERALTQIKSIDSFSSNKDINKSLENVVYNRIERPSHLEIENSEAFLISELTSTIDKKNEVDQKQEQKTINNKLKI